MTVKRMRTYSPSETEIRKAWHVIDATDQVLGRLAAHIAVLLRGKHKPMYTPHMDTGDYVVVINASKVKLTGNKPHDKLYYRHSQYPGGLKSVALEELLAKQPRKVIENAVRGMLPRNRLGRRLLRHLMVYEGPTHPHEAQIGATQRYGGTTIGSKRPRPAAR